MSGAVTVGSRSGSVMQLRWSGCGGFEARFPTVNIAFDPYFFDETLTAAEPVYDYIFITPRALRSLSSPHPGPALPGRQISAAPCESRVRRPRAADGRGLRRRGFRT